MYPSIPRTFINRLMRGGRTVMVQTPAHTRQDGALGSPGGTSAIVQMPASTQTTTPFPVSLSVTSEETLKG